MVIDFDALTAIMFGIIYIPIGVYLVRRKGTDGVGLLFNFVFYAYIVGVIAKTMFPIFFDESMRQSMGNNVWEHVNFVPLLHLTVNEIKSSFLNVLMFFPLGYLIPFVTLDNRLGKVIVYGVAFSGVIESLQLLIGLAIGFTVRYIDVNDIIFNVLGCFLGYGAFVVYGSVVILLNNRGKLPQGRITNYIIAHITHLSR